MIRTRVIPCLLLRGDGLYKSVKFSDYTYIGDPLNAVRIFNEKECHELVFLDITATREGRGPRFDLVKDIAGECFMPFSYGGGVHTMADIAALLRLGVEKVVLNTVAFENPAFVREAAREYGSSTMVISLDVKKNFWGSYRVCTHGGQKVRDVDPVTQAQKMEECGAGEIFLTSVDRDGTQQGYDLSLIHAVSSAVGVPVVACGGAGKVEDFGAAVHEGGASAVAAGSLFVFYGKRRAVLINFPSDEELRPFLA